MRQRRLNPSCNRKGIATLWVILCLPIALVLLCLVADVGRLWVERATLENTLEIAALAAVKELGDQGASDDAIPKANAVGIAFAAANAVAEQEVALTSDDFVYGTVEFTEEKNIFHLGSIDEANLNDDSDEDEDEDEDAEEEAGNGKVLPAVYCMGQQAVRSLCGLGDYNVYAATAACYDPGSGRVLLVQIDEFQEENVAIATPTISTTLP